MSWSVVCLPSGKTVQGVRLDEVDSRPILFEVPAGCAAQRLQLAGAAADVPSQAEADFSSLRLVRAEGS